jgi:RNA polymerase subunit RPABC4/transcription elongation factor Spt4
MNWNNISLIVLGLAAFMGAFVVALWVSLVIWTFRDMRARTRDAFAQLLASLMVLVLGPFGILLYFVLRPRETLAEKYERSLEEEALLQDIEERHICPGCKQPIEPDYVLCPICHTRLRQPCAHCGRLIHPRWSVCPYCASSQRPVPGVERAGQVTLLDLEKEEMQSLRPGDAPNQDSEMDEESLAELSALGGDDNEPLPPILDRQPQDSRDRPRPLIDPELSSEAQDDGVHSVEQPPSLDSSDSARDTQPIDVKTTDEPTAGRPLSLFGRRQ